jgi:hypothetical protein
LLDGVTLSERDIERLESWYESGDLASLRGAFPGYVVSNLTRTAQAIADAEERGRQDERTETETWKANSTSWAKACTEWSEWANTECTRLGIVPTAGATFGSRAQRLGLRLALHQLPLSVWDAALKRLLELATDGDRAALEGEP